LLGRGLPLDEQGGSQMKHAGRVLWLAAGLVLGAAGAALYFAPAGSAEASNDRSEDYILCTGAVSITPRIPTDGIWLLDYRAGKLLATVIDRNVGKVAGWAEMDLVNEFGIPPKQNVHFLMTTGTVTNGQTALYLAETTTGKFGVYTMGPRLDGRPGVVIRRHDQLLFRQPLPN
jgi:hypothetical protein